MATTVFLLLWWSLYKVAELKRIKTKKNIMNTIEFYDGRKWEFNEYGSFSDARDVLRSCGSGYVSYYDVDGDTHICEFAVVRGGLMCLGELIAITDGKDVFDCTGKHFDSRIYELAGKLVRFEKDDFAGWSL